MRQSALVLSQSEATLKRISQIGSMEIKSPVLDLRNPKGWEKYFQSVLEAIRAVRQAAQDTETLTAEPVTPGIEERYAAVIQMRELVEAGKEPLEILSKISQTIVKFKDDQAALEALRGFKVKLNALEASKIPLTDKQKEAKLFLNDPKFQTARDESSLTVKFLELVFKGEEAKFDKNKLLTVDKAFIETMKQQPKAEMFFILIPVLINLLINGPVPFIFQLKPREHQSL